MNIKRTLRRIVGAQSFLDDPASLASYSYDSSLQTATPDFVLLPQTTEQVAEIVRLLYQEGIPYVGRGAGTNLSGGSIPLKKGAVIALSRMKKILSIDTENQCARVQPGITNLELQDALKPHGYFYAPDPASQKVSTLGGNVAENSGGPHCLKYGVTTNHILGVKLVAPDGAIIELGGETLDSPGPDMLGLFVGSEGTFGIATEIVCRIMPLPHSVKTMLAIYNSTDDASQTVSDIIAAGIVPATLEMMDNVVIRAVEASLHAGYPTDAAAVLIIEVDGIEGSLDGTVHDIDAICRRNKVRDVHIARDEQERDKLWAGRRGAFGAIARVCLNYLVSDGTVPRDKLPEVLRQVTNIGHKYDLVIASVFHAGDGNLHPLVFFDSRDRDQVERVHHAGMEILEVCTAAGGTISGEHGVGCEKIEAMPLFFGSDEIELMRGIKRALDPANLCNPGKILPASLPCPSEPGMGAAPCTPVERHEPGIRIEVQQAAPSASPRRTYLPSNPEELASLIRQLRESSKSFVPIGACTLFENLPSRGMADAIICSPQTSTVIEHDAANLTVTAGAWLLIGELQKKLREAGQFLPLDAPPRATLGGIVASALPGPRRHLYGAVRDAMLGLKFVSGTGQILKAGGKTVKNVAGYDFGKLLIGSWGTLGIITEITFRLIPLPKASGAFAASFERAEDAYEAARSIVATGLNPSLVTLMNARAAAALADELVMQIPAPNYYALILGAEGFDSAVQKQLAEMDKICAAKSGGSLARFDRDAYGDLVAAVTRVCYPPRQPYPWEKQSADLPDSGLGFQFLYPENPKLPPLTREEMNKEFPTPTWSIKGEDDYPLLSVQVSVPCKDTVAVLRKIKAVETEHQIASFTTANLASGSVYSHFVGKKQEPSGMTEKVISALTTSPDVGMQHAAPLQRPPSASSITLLSVPRGYVGPLIIGNRAPSSWLKSIKKCFDPDGLLNPGVAQW